MPSSISQFRLNPRGFDQFRRSAGVDGMLVAAGERVAEAAGGAPDFLVWRAPNKTRARVIVITATTKGRLAEAKHRALTRAIDAGRI